MVKRLFVNSLAALALASPLSAQDIFIGMKPAQEHQLDVRLSAVENSAGIHQHNLQLIPKYWNTHFWLYANIPIRHVASPTNANTGIGDVLLGAGPRGKKGPLSWFGYGAFTIPSRNPKSPALGSGETMGKVGGLATLLSSTQQYELSGMSERSWSKKGAEEYAAGIIGASKIGKRMRAGLGGNYTARSNGQSSKSLVGVVRWAPSPLWHSHLRVVYDVQVTKAPTSKRYELIMRRNW